MAKGSFKVDVSPEMQVYRLLQSLPYTIESALAEFVDNSLQSYLDHYRELRPPDSKKDDLKVTITVDSLTNNITIEDDAAGIGRDKFQDALSLGIDTSSKHAKDSLSVYGVGMKSAAVWLANEWAIETSSLRKKERLTTVFDLDALLRDKREHITVESEPEALEKHFTKISILNSPRKENEKYYKDVVLPRLQETFLNFPFMNIEIIYDNLKLSTQNVYLDNPLPLHYPKVNKDAQPIDNKNITWRKDIDIDWAGHEIKGFVMLMNKGSYYQPGLRLFRNKRLIQGTKKQPNRPGHLLGTSNKYAAQRIYGELHLNTVPINFLKTAFGENLESLYGAIKTELEKQPNMISQADRYRARKAPPPPPDPIPLTKKKTKPVYEPEPDNIEFSQDFYDKLGKLKNHKLRRLYKSLCEISLTDHGILAYVGMSVFFEVLSTALGNIRADGKRDSFDSFFNKKINTLYTGNKSTKDTKDNRKSIIAEIRSKGNANKHEGRHHFVVATQLHADMEELTPFLIECIDEYNQKII